MKTALKPMINNNNLNLSLNFDTAKKFLICGELLKFNLKVTSTDFPSDEIEEFLERIGASVETMEIVEETSEIMSLSESSLSESLSKSRKMKSVESLSNLLRTTTLAVNKSSSSDSMSSVTARRFDSLSRTRSNDSKAIWNSEDNSILIPLEAFIDSDCFSLNCRKAIVKFKISLNELVPIEDDFIKYNDYDNVVDKTNLTSQISHRIQKIGHIEVPFPVIRPLEVSIRTHSLAPTEAILQINLEYSHDLESGVARENDNLLEIDKVNLVLSDSLTSRTQNSTKFRISPVSDSQVPFVFETSPQQQSLLYIWKLLTSNHDDDDDDDDFNEFHLRVELFGKLLSESQISLSFESSVPIFNLFPKIENSGVQIISTKLLTSSDDPLKIFEAFQVELILHNYGEDCVSLNLTVLSVQNVKKSKSKSKMISFSNPVQEWFQMEKRKKTPALLLMNPLNPLKIENLPSRGSKAIRLQLIPVKRGHFSLKSELKIEEIRSCDLIEFKDIIIQVE